MRTTKAKPRPTATEAALAAVSRRALTEAELRRRLVRRYPEDEVDGAVARLKEWRYLSDAEVADVAAERGVARRVGSARVARELRARGVADETATGAVARAYEAREGQLLDEALEEALRAMGGVRSSKELAKLARRLVARGFDPEEVAERLRGVGPGMEEA